MVLARVVAVTGVKRSGKTRTAELLIRKLRSLGYSVAAAKRVHDAGFSIDTPRKDSWRLGEAGANPRVVVSPDEVAVIWRGKTVTSLEELIRLVGDSDFIVMEGFYETVKGRGDVVRVRVVVSRGEVVEADADYLVTFDEALSDVALKLPERIEELVNGILGASVRRGGVGEQE